MQSVNDAIASYEMHLQDASKEQTKARDLFTSFLMVTYDVMKRSEELAFHDPAIPLRRCGRDYHSKRLPYTDCPFLVRVRKTGVKEENNENPRYTSFADYLTRGLAQVSVAGIKEAMKGIAKSPASKQVTSEMVTEKYAEYKRIKREIGTESHINSRIIAIKMMLGEQVTVKKL